jgi:hypothetical protein
MPHDKTSPSFMDRRRFLHYTWFGVGASLSLALSPGDGLFAAPRFVAPVPADPQSLGRRTVPVGWRGARQRDAADRGAGHRRRLR